LPFSKDLPVKFYLYISDAKVEMLASQLRRGLGGRVASWNVDVSAGPAKIGAEGRSIDPTRYQQIEKITRHIRKHEDCGTIDAPGTFVFDRQSVRWGPFTSDKRIVFFTGLTQKTVFALGGSSSYLLQAPRREDSAYPSGGSAQWILQSALLRAFGHPENPNYQPAAPDYDGALLAAVGSLAAAFEHRGRVPPTRVEFLAKRLVVGEPYKGYYDNYLDEDFSAKDIVFLGSPVYVAMVD
jgi:hypothetical protein